jgi:hypothetical protein
MAAGYMTAAARREAGFMPRAGVGKPAELKHFLRKAAQQLVICGSPMRGGESLLCGFEFVLNLISIIAASLSRAILEG